MTDPSLRQRYEDILRAYQENLESFELFHKRIKDFFESRSLSDYVHSVRYRLKNLDHLLEKIDRKNAADAALPADQQRGPITPENLFSRVTDIAGIRVLHLHLSQFEHIHNAILAKVEEEEFVLFEEPKAYTWDNDSGRYFDSLGVAREVKESFYTSIHYVLKPNSRSQATCEVQVRTLLEEVWGEVDHTMNYPFKSADEQCCEQIRILARLVGAGSHLADSIMRRYGSGHEV